MANERKEHSDQMLNVRKFEQYELILNMLLKDVRCVFPAVQPPSGS